MSENQFRRITGVSRNRYLIARDKYTNLSVMSLSQLNCALDYDQSKSKVGTNKAKRQLQSLLRKVNRTSVKKIAGVKISSIIKKLDSVNFRVFTWGLIIDKNAFRGTGINITEKNTIVVNGGYWRSLHLADYAPTFILHELLGAIGINDGEYQYSTALWRISKQPKRARTIKKNLRNSLFASIAKQFRMIAGSGTATVVGNGGDPSELYTKMTLFNSIPNFLKAYRAANADPRFKALTIDDFERGYFHLKIRATKLAFIGFVPNITEPSLLDQFPDVKHGDSLGLVPFHLIHINNISGLIEVIGKVANDLNTYLAIEKSKGRL